MQRPLGKFKYLIVCLLGNPVIQVSFFQSLVTTFLYNYHNSLPKKHLLNLFLSSKSSSSSWSFAVCPLLLDHLLVAASERALKVSSLNGVSHFGFIDGGNKNVFFPHYHIKYSFIVYCITYLINYNCIQLPFKSIYRNHMNKNTPKGKPGSRIPFNSKISRENQRIVAAGRCHSESIKVAVWHSSWLPRKCHQTIPGLPLRTI